MDLQGTPIGSTNQGLKNTTDPSSKQSVQESAGQVTSDSLAAESYNDDGKFAENRNAAPSGTKGASSTLNTTDTSAARKIDPEDDSYQGEGQKYPEGSGGQGQFSGTTTTTGYYGGPSGNSGSGGGTSSTGTGSSNDQGFSASGDTTDIGGASTSGEDKISSSKTTRSGNNYGGASSDNTSGSNNGSNNNNNNSSSSSSGNAGVAPNYVADVYLGDTNKPKGANLKEDDNLEGKRVTDFEIGDENDPGRAALQSFENANARTSTGQATTQREIDGENQYQNLEDEAS